MKFRDLLNEVKDEDLSYIESFIREEFPKGSKIRYGRTKIDSVYITWGKINESRIPKHGKVAIAKKNGDIEIDGKVVSEGQYMYGYNINKMLSKLNKKLKMENANSISKIGISFDEADSLSGEMFNAVFRLGDY